ncbi:MAG: serine/threonine protein kinase [Lachnospiraceae bacterium]|nr:serine/threonine protein kinase [Lachnospiraceae bacterium]
MLSNGMILRDRYRIVKRIGRGGSSSVYLAEDLSIGKKWAVKFIESGYDDTGWLAQNEITMMIRLDYEMFPRIVDAWQEAEGYIIVSDYIEGVTLEKVLKEKQIGKKTILKWCMDIAGAIKYLHECKPSILYLDLKLENIMVRKDGTLKLIDFGIAGRIAQRGSLYGTPGYAAPEQYYNRGDMLDERTDVFAFGMLMYAMFKNQRPVGELKEQTNIIRNDRKISNKIRAFILKCIREDKDERYLDMKEVIKVLDSLRGKEIYKIKLVAAALTAVICIVFSGFTTVRYVLMEPVKDVATDMAKELEGHIVDGEYTDEGIRIICGYIEAGSLDESACERFSYEVGRNYFLFKRNYREALRYFRNVDEEKHPDSVYYKQLCELQLSFEEDNEEYANTIREFASYNRCLGYEDARFDNTLMLANLYEGMQYSSEEAVEEEKKCLEEGLKDLKYAVMSGLYEDAGSKYEAEYCRRLCMLCEMAGDNDNAVRYGEQALKLISSGNEVVRQDIRKRMQILKCGAKGIGQL